MYLNIMPLVRRPVARLLSAAVLALATAEASREGPFVEYGLDVDLAEDDECVASSGTYEQCALSALQHRVLRQSAPVARASAVASKVGCHTAVSGDACWSEIQWAMTQGLEARPDWYAGLTATSSTLEFQEKIHASSPGKCPKPCGGVRAKEAAPWCKGTPLPKLWAADTSGPGVSVKILSYNLFWWNLFGQRGGNANSAGNLIKESMADLPFDFMGFQECEDPEKVLGPVGLLEEYDAVLGTHAICMAYRKSAWTLLERGEDDVAEDMPTRFYGKRGTQWLRVKHIETGQTAFFANHHGPLSINSGGLCGGEATAANILHLMGSKAQAGDLLVLVGDFNANAASLTVQGLWANLVHVFNGDSFGGVDNVFSNVARSAILSTATLGSGGSDHHAISAVVRLGAPEAQGLEADGTRRTPLSAVEDLLGVGAPGDDWAVWWCGRMEHNVDYAIGESAWSHTMAQPDPDRCCKECQKEPNCKAFKWVDWHDVTHGAACLMFGGELLSRSDKQGTVSGLPATAAAALAAQAAAAAKGSM